MDELLPWDDGHGDTKGWDRASVAHRSSKPYVPDISAADLRLPNEAGRVRTLALCTACALAMTFLYVAIPLWVVGWFVSLPPWAAAIPLASFVGLTGALFTVSTHETRDLRTLAREL